MTLEELQRVNGYVAHRVRLNEQLGLTSLPNETRDEYKQELLRIESWLLAQGIVV